MTPQTSSLIQLGVEQPAGQTQTSATISPPEIEKGDFSLTSQVRAIRSVDQIYQICDAIFSPDSERNYINGLIAEEANDSPPFPSSYMEQKGRKFRHNMSTCFYSGVVNPVITQPVDLIRQTQYLTQAALPEKDDPEGTKTEAYRRESTKLIKRWPRFWAHLYNLANEDVNFGYTISICDDPDDWRTQEYRQDEFGVHDDTGQDPSECQFFAMRKSVLIHKFIEMIKKVGLDPDLSDAGPWNMDACIEALNKAMPQDRGQGSGAGGQQPSFRTFVELIREGNAGASYDPRALTIDIYTLLATESDGKVSKFIVLQSDHKLLYESLDEFESLSDIACFYSLEPGSGKLNGSKGLGRRIRNMAKSQERGRNKGADNVYLGGLVWGIAAAGQGARLRVLDWGAIIEGPVDVKPNIFPTDTQGFDAMDERLTRYCQQAVGQFIQQKPAEGKPANKRTAHEAVIDAQKEQERKASWLQRFLGQFQTEVALMLKRAGDQNTSDKEAKEYQRILIEDCRLTRENLDYLRVQPASDIMEDMTLKRNQALIQLFPFIKASRFFKQYDVEREISLRFLGTELTNKFMLPNGVDPVDEAANINKQILEIAAIKTGEHPNVIPSDNHIVHSKYVIGDLQHSEQDIATRVADGSMDGPTMDNVQTLINHGKAHVGQGLKRAKIDKKNEDMALLKQHETFYEDAQKKHDEAIKTLLKHKEPKAQQPQQPQQQVGAGPGSNILQLLQPPGGGGESPAAGAQATEAKEKTYGGMSEKVITAWISKYELLPQLERAKLEEITGLGDGLSHTRGNPQLEPQQAA